MQHLCSLFDVNHDHISEILGLAGGIKANFREGKRPPLLQGYVITLVFEKPSLRTRNSFETAAMQLGGNSIFLSSADAGLNGREQLSDIARVLSSYADAIVLRTYSQDLIDQFAQHSGCSIINGLSDSRHPCQALTDLLTIQEEFGRLDGQHIVFVGDGNNIASSLAIAAAVTGLPLTVCSPDGYQIAPSFLDDLRQRYPNSQIQLSSDPASAVREADVVYTDVWASMGQESEADQRQRDFAGFQVNGQLMAQAPANCRFMHDLPAKRGQEVTGEVIDGPQSIVFKQAENRLHLAKGLLVWLLRQDVELGVAIGAVAQA